MGHADGRCVADEHMSFRLWTMIIMTVVKSIRPSWPSMPMFYNQCFIHIFCIIIYIYNIYICNSVIIFNRKNDRLPPFSVFPVRNMTGFS